MGSGSGAVGVAGLVEIKVAFGRASVRIGLGLLQQFVEFAIEDRLAIVVVGERLLKYLFPPCRLPFQIGYRFGEILDGRRLFWVLCTDDNCGDRVDLESGLATRTVHFDHFFSHTENLAQAAAL